MSNDKLYHRLVWQPGTWLHDEWWQAIGLQQWRTSYAVMPALAQRAMDHEIQRRRSLGGTVGGRIMERTPVQEALLTAFERLPVLLIALGVTLSRCPDYLLWRPYRQALSDYLTENQLSQVWAVWRGGDRSPVIDPEGLIPFALRLGTAALQQSLADDPVWQAVRYTLPVVSGTDVSVSDSPLPLFLRLERFL